MPTVIDSLVVTLGLDASQFNAQQKKAVQYLRDVQSAADTHVRPAKARVGEFEQGLQALQGRLLSIAGIFMGGMGFQRFVQHVTEATTQAGYLAKSLGVSIEELGKWQGIAASVGASSSEIASSFQAIQDAVSQLNTTGATQLQKFSHMTQAAGQGPAVNLKNQDGSRRQPTDILMDLSRWYEAQNDKADASYLLRSVGGMSQGMVSLLGLGPEKLASRLKEYAQFAPTQDQVKALTNLQEEFAKLKARAEDLGRSFTALIAPDLIEFFKSLERIIKAAKGGGFWEGAKAADAEASKATGEAATATKGWISDKWHRAGRAWRKYIGRETPEDRAAEEAERAGQPPQGQQTPSAPAPQQNMQRSGPRMGQFSPSGTSGTYRPPYSLTAADLSDETVSIIAGEAQNNQRSTDAVINNMLNRVGSSGWGPSADINAVATAPGQYEAAWRFKGRRYSPERMQQIRDRMRAIASGSEPDNTGGSNEFRASSYDGPWTWRNLDKPIVGGNRYGFNPRAPNGPFAPYGTARTGQSPRTGAPSQSFDDFLGKLPRSGAGDAIGRDGGTTDNRRTSQTTIGEMHVTVPPGSDPAAYGTGIQQELRRFDSVQNSLTGLQ